MAAKGLQPLGLFRGLAVARCKPGEMCIGGGQGAAGLFGVL
ncbi:hypothetical protein ACFSHT_05190 [Paraburkholderia silviterrae]|nr:hypothetical protein [Paraburkholderia silviterrae]